MSPNSDALNAWAVSVAIAGSLVGENMGVLVGTYGVILLGWFFGLMYGLWVRSMDSKMPMWAYVIFTFGVTMLSTVTLAEIASKVSPMAVQWNSLLFPIAVAIPALPHKWNALGTYLFELWKAWDAARKGAKP